MQSVRPAGRSSGFLLAGVEIEALGIIPPVVIVGDADQIRAEQDGDALDLGRRGGARPVVPPCGRRWVGRPERVLEPLAHLTRLAALGERQRADPAGVAQGVVAQAKPVARARHHHAVGFVKVAGCLGPDFRVPQGAGIDVVALVEALEFVGSFDARGGVGRAGQPIGDGFAAAHSAARAVGADAGSRN